MNTPEEFLSAIWRDPQDGFYFVAMPNQHGEGYRHFGFKTPQDAALFIDDRVDAGIELYFALAKYREINVMVGDKRRQRVASNVLSISALWMDLDVGPEPHKYQSKEQAVLSLRDFCRAVKLPKPAVVDSGGGIHVYWVLTKPQLPANWLKLATWLKAAAAHWGLKQDNSRTADMASVLRVPGTYNHKQAARRPVTLLTRVDYFKASELAGVLQAYCSAHAVSTLPAKGPTTILGAPPVGAVAGVAGLSQFGQVATDGIVKYDPVKLDLVAQSCPQVRAVLGCGGNVPEPLWYAAVGLACFTDDSDEDIHRVSDGHPEYDEDATIAKAQQWRANVSGPATCQRFESANPQGCQGCSHYGKINTPAVLGRVVPEVREPMTPATPQRIAVAQAQPTYVYGAKGEIVGVVAPCPPGWRRVPAGIEKAVKGKDGALDWVLVIPGLDILPVNWVYDKEKGTHMLVRFTTTRGEVSDIMVDVAGLMGGTSVGSIFSRLCIFVTSAMITAAKDYLVSYMQSLRDAQRSEEVRRQLGWQDDGSFVLPEMVYYPDGREVHSRPDEQNAAIFDYFQLKGDDAAWKRGLELYNRPGGEPYAFTMLSGLASVLMRMTPYHGVTLSLKGPSGVGKTTLQKMLLGAWGHPQKMASTRDTKKSREQRMGVTNSLPLCLDEASNMDALEASSTVYAITEGTFGTALTQARRQNTDPASWDLISVWSMNRSLRSLMAQGKQDTEAESLRVFELEFIAPLNDQKEIDDVMRSMLENHGAAGRAFISYVVKHYDEVKALVQTNVEKVMDQASARVQERYWVALVALVLTANQVARKLGLSNVSTGALAKFGVAQLRRNRDATSISRADGMNILSRYLSENSTGVMSVAQNLSTGQLSMIDPPRSGIIATLYTSHGLMLVDRGAFGRWCNKTKVDAEAVIAELKAAGVVTRDGLRASLSAGLSGVVAGVCVAFQVDCRHQAMTFSALPTSSSGAKVA